MPEPADETSSAPAGVPVDWFDDGLLWVVNAAVFHPRGFALAVDPESGAMSLLGDGTEPWSFDASISTIIDGRFSSFEALLERARTGGDA